MQNTIAGAVFMCAFAICVLTFTIGEFVIIHRYGAMSFGMLIAMPAGVLFFGLGIFYLFTKPVRLQDIDPDYNPILRKEEGEEEIK